MPHLFLPLEVSWLSFHLCCISNPTEHPCIPSLVMHWPFSFFKSFYMCGKLLAWAAIYRRPVVSLRSNHFDWFMDETVLWKLMVSIKVPAAFSTIVMVDQKRHFPGIPPKHSSLNLDGVFSLLRVCENQNFTCLFFFLQHPTHLVAFMLQLLLCECEFSIKSSMIKEVLYKISQFIIHEYQ